jgi:hypothetical protein
MKLKLFLIALMIVSMGFNASAQESCEVLEAQQAELADGDTALQRGMNVQSDDTVVTGSDGEATFLCGSQVVSVGADSEGELERIGQSESIETNTTIQPEVEISEALKQTEEMEKNIDTINENLDQALPGPVKSLVLGDRVNFQVDNTTLGIRSNESAITGFEQGGVEDPTLEISMNESTIERVLQSNNTMQSFSEVYDGEGIQIEAHSFSNKVIFGAVSIANKAYGFFSGLM